MNVPIVTFISDFGTRDYYSGVVKGALLTVNPMINIVDISHNVKSYDIVQGAFILKNTYKFFPKDTIHIVSVNNHYQPNCCFLAIRYDGHYFIGPDNGLFSLVFPDIVLKNVYELPYLVKSSNPLVDVYKNGVKHIISDLPFNEIGIPLESIEQRITFQPVITKNRIRGSIIHVDAYGNSITNISKDLIEKVGNGRPLKLYFKTHEPLERISAIYGEVAVGETLCLINSSNALEIAINMGEAASMLGLHVDENVLIEFENN